MQYKSKDRIICVSFPRSGSRFLRKLILTCFPEDVVYYESYTHHLLPKNKGFRLCDANLIKTHDFELAGKNVLAEIFPTNRKYIIQIRQPLDSIISWYELDIKKNGNNDNESSWLSFLDDKLIFWKNFYDLWVRRLSNDSLLVLYDNLFNFTLETLSNVTKFMNVRKQLDVDTLKQKISSIPFYQYGNDANSRKDKKRVVNEFKYYDANKFNRIIAELEKDYPLS